MTVQTDARISAAPSGSVRIVAIVQPFMLPKAEPATPKGTESAEDALDLKRARDAESKAAARGEAPLSWDSVRNQLDG